MDREELKTLLSERMSDMFILGSMGQYYEAQEKFEDLLTAVLEGFE